MSIPYIQQSMAQVRAVNGTQITYPFLDSGDTDTRVYTLICSQLASSYQSNQIELDDTMSNAASAGVIELPGGWTDSNAYFVGDTGHETKDSIISFTRTFANIPKPVSLTEGSRFYTFPGQQSVNYEIGRKTIIALSMTAGTPGITITTSIDHELVAGGIYNFLIEYTVGNDPFVYSVSSDFSVIEVPTSKTLRIDIGQYWPNQTTLNVVYGNVTLRVGKAAARNLNVSNVTHYNYILPGVTPGIADVLDINVPPVFSVINLALNAALDERYNPKIVSSATMPTDDEYTAMIVNNRNIIIESSLKIWAGNILVMKTTTTKAK